MPNSACAFALAVLAFNILFFIFIIGVILNYLSIPEAARDYLKVSRSTVYRLIDGGDLQLVHVRGCSRIPAQSLYDFMEKIQKEVS